MACLPVVSGFDPSSDAPWPVLRYALPDGTWHEFAMPELGKADLPFHVIDAQTVLIPSWMEQSLFAVSFGPKGFGEPKPLVSGSLRVDRRPRIKRSNAKRRMIWEISD